MEQWYYKQIAPRANRLGQHSTPSPFKIILLMFLLSRLYFLTIAIFSAYFIKTEPGYLGVQVSQDEPFWIWVWANMDGRHFINIASLGYSGTNFAYFPLYPLLINLVSHLGLTPIYAGILISSLATIFSLYFLFKVVNLDDYGGKDKRRFSLEVIILLLFFPFAFILTSVYSDSLFLLLTTASFYFARSRHWLIAGIFAFLASLTRLSGIALIPALALEWWLQGGKKKIGWRGLTAPLGSLLGFVVYPLYLQIQFGNWRLFQSAFSAWKQDQFVLLPQVIFRYFKILTIVSPALLVYWVAALELVSFILYFALAIYVTKKIRVSYGLFMMVVLLLVTFTGTFAGTPRYLNHLFPAFIGLAIYLSTHPRFRFIYYLATIILGITLTALFVRGYFVG